jgi:hypothetical protein
MWCIFLACFFLLLSQVRSTEKQSQTLNIVPLHILLICYLPPHHRDDYCNDDHNCKDNRAAAIPPCLLSPPPPEQLPPLSGAPSFLSRNRELPLLYCCGCSLLSLSVIVVVDWGALKKTSPLTFQMANFETQQILKKNKKVYSLIALRKFDRVFSALFVNELFLGKCDSRSRENPPFLVRCSMFDFQFLAPPENLDRA